jgi:hypothetical protein
LDFLLTSPTFVNDVLKKSFLADCEKYSAFS